MEYALNHLKGSSCIVTNCGIHCRLDCTGNELGDSIRNGSTIVKRRAGTRGCFFYSLDDVEFIEDQNGNPIDCIPPRLANPNTLLSFTIFSGLIKYLIDLPESLPGQGLLGKIADLRSRGERLNRELLPPLPIMIEKQAYEIIGLVSCNNSACVHNLGPANIRPFPMIEK